MVSEDCEGISIGPMNTLTDCEQQIITIKIDSDKKKKKNLKTQETNAKIHCWYINLARLILVPPI